MVRASQGIRPEQHQGGKHLAEHQVRPSTRKSSFAARGALEGSVRRAGRRAPRSPHKTGASGGETQAVQRPPSQRPRHHLGAAELLGIRKEVRDDSEALTYRGSEGVRIGRGQSHLQCRCESSRRSCGRPWKSQAKDWARAGTSPPFGHIRVTGSDQARVQARFPVMAFICFSMASTVASSAPFEAGTCFLASPEADASSQPPASLPGP